MWRQEFGVRKMLLPASVPGRCLYLPRALTRITQPTLGRVGVLTGVGGVTVQDTADSAVTQKGWVT